MRVTMGRKEWDDTFVLDRMPVRYQPVLGSGHQTQLPSATDEDRPAAASTALLSRHRPSTAGPLGRSKSGRLWSALSLSVPNGRRAAGGQGGLCPACSARARSVVEDVDQSSSTQANAARMAHRAAEKAATRAYMAIGRAQENLELAKKDLDKELAAATERADRLMAELQSCVTSELASRGVQLHSAALDLPRRGIRLLRAVDFSESGDVSEEGGDVLAEVALLFAACNKELRSRGSPELRLLVESRGERRVAIARERIVAALTKLSKATLAGGAVSARDGGGDELSLVVAAPWEALPGGEATEEARVVTAARRRLAQCEKEVEQAKEASERAQAAVGPLAEAARTASLDAQSAMDARMQEAGEALKTLEALESASGLTSELRRLLKSVRREREQAATEREEAEALAKHIKFRLEKVEELQARAAEEMKEAERATLAADRARWAAEDAKKDARRELLAVRQATRESEAAADSARREQEAARLVVFAAERAREAHRVAESGLAHALQEAARARESRAAEEEAMHQAVEARERMEAGMQGMRDELAARAREQRQKVESGMKETIAKRAATQEEIAEIQAKAAGELTEVEAAQAAAEAARDEAIAQKTALEEQISQLRQQVNELEESNRAAEAARKERLAKMVEEVATAVKRDLRARDVYLKAVDMDLSAGRFTLKEDLPFKAGGAAFSRVDEADEPASKSDGPAAEADDDEEGGGAAGESATAETEASTAAVEVTALDEMAAALAVAIRELAKRNEPPLALTVECHHSDNGEDSGPLSQQRANVCKDYLVDKVVSLSGGTLKSESVRDMIIARGCSDDSRSAMLFNVDLTHDR